MDSIAVSHITHLSPKYQQVWDLREEILRKPLGLSLKNEDMSRDHNAVIFIGEHNDKVVGCLLLHHVDADHVQLRAMAVYNEWQSKGVGRQIVVAAERYASEKGYCKMVLHSRKVALGFYKALGYTVTSDEFTEVGIPHFMMEKDLNKHG